MEEAEENYEMLDRNAEELISVLHGVHCDNSKLQYYTKTPSEREVSIMPITPFVFEYFLFNSLYQVNWNKTDTDDFSKLDEFGKQKAFINFIKLHANRKTANLYRAFSNSEHYENPTERTLTFLCRTHASLSFLARVRSVSLSRWVNCVVS